jgi:membrane protease YdiL (CAAX protease family)
MVWIDRRLLVARVGRWQWSWGLVGLVTVGAVMLGVVSVLYAIGDEWEAGAYLLGLGVSDDVVLSPGRWDTYTSFVFLSLPAIVATCVAIKWVHGWSIGSVLGVDGRFAWADFGKSAAALFAIYAIWSALDFAITPERYAWHAEHWQVVFWIALAGVVILPQAFSEDFLFNAYLARLWGAVVPVRFVVAITLSLAFGLLHGWNADVARDPLPSILAMAAGQLVAILVYFRTGSLAATVGLHWMNNAFLACVIATEPGYKSDLALFVYRDPVLSAGGSYLYDPWFWLALASGPMLTWFVLSWRRSPFYIPDRCNVAPSQSGCIVAEGTTDDAPADASAV